MYRGQFLRIVHLYMSNVSLCHQHSKFQLHQCHFQIYHWLDYPKFDIHWIYNQYSKDDNMSNLLKNNFVISLSQNSMWHFLMLSINSNQTKKNWSLIGGLKHFTVLLKMLHFDFCVLALYFNMLCYRPQVGVLNTTTYCVLF